jgi:hypothetical protein
MPITELEELYDRDRHWIYRAIAAQQAEALARPIREARDKERAKEEAEARKEAQRAASREAKRAAWRNQRQLDELLTEAD